MPKKFILNDETKVNSYGFRVKNSGIDLARFKDNPVMLNMHKDGTMDVVGRWVNVRIEGVNLVADAEFDLDDPQAALLAGKVERGFVKGASIGIQATARFERGKDGVPVLVKGELMEASICAIPSNANAITLYSAKGSIITEKEFKLT